MNYNLSVGDILIRPKALGILEHVGMVVGSNAVLQNTPEKGEHQTTVDEFSDGKPITVQPTGLDPLIVRVRATQILANPKKYHVFFRNCEHTVYEVMRGIARSPQLKAFLFIAFLAFLAWLLLRRR